MQTDPKQDISAERAVLGAIMLENKAILKVSDILIVNDFFNKAHQIIYKTMLEMNNDAKPIDLITLNTCISNKGLLSSVGDSEYLALISGQVPTAVNVKYYAGIVKDKAIRRNSIALLTNLTTLAEDETCKISDIFSHAETGFRDIVTKNSDTCKHVSDGLKMVYNKLTNPDYKDDSISSGLIDLDEKITGFLPGCLYLLAGRPAMGKTALALNLAKNIASRGSKVLFFSMEMTRELLQERLICAESGVNMQEAHKNKETEDYMSEIVDATGMIHRLPIFIDDTGDLTSTQIRSRSLSAQLNHGVNFIIIDYIQLMGAVDRKAIREQQISEMSRTLMTLAKELKVPILALSQLNRDCEKRVNKRPMASDLRESGSLEQDAYAVMLLYRGYVYRDEGVNINEAELIIGKNRNGETGVVPLFFDASIMKFGNAMRDIT
jgi:replicative DNA helicase